MPKKETGRKVPLNKAQRRAMQNDARKFNANEGRGASGFLNLLANLKGKKKK
jgi:hypothetical protein